MISIRCIVQRQLAHCWMGQMTCGEVFFFEMQLVCALALHLKKAGSSLLTTLHISGE